jgi:very-short-patch-repair endonuclease
MLKTFQKKLRTNQTDAELKLWQELRDRRFQNFKFRRQCILQGYIVDFVCLKERLIIELDGGQHIEQIEYDRERTRKLESNGFRVLRFWDHDMLKNKEEVLQAIYQELLNET